jgi:N-terminal acetyltransferase B complex catalytic subunit
MATVRRFVCDDLFRFNNVNLDKLTETYHMPFYLQYLGTWPNLCQTGVYCPYCVRIRVP